METCRPPKWEKWRYIPEPKLWECVALSLNIEPDKVRHNSREWVNGGPPFNESEEFQDRIDIAKSNLFKLQPTSDGVFSLITSTIPLTVFSYWAISIRWTIPKELAEMASSTPDVNHTEDAPQEKLLASSEYWNRLETIAAKTIKQFPAWRDSQSKIQKSGNLQHWLTATIGADTREAEILKKILSDSFKGLQ